MRWLSICLCALAALTSLAACGKSQPQQATATPSLTVNMDLTVQLRDHRVTTVNLLPSGHPSGVVALEAVHDGRLVTIGSQRFSRINDPGYLTVDVSTRDIEMGWNIPQGTRALQGNCCEGRSKRRTPVGRKGQHWDGSLVALLTSFQSPAAGLS